MTAPTAILFLALVALLATQAHAAAVTLDKRSRGCSDQPYFHADLPHVFDAGSAPAATWEECHDQGTAAGHKAIVYRYDQQRCYFKSFPVNGAKTYYCGRRQPYHYDVAGFDVANYATFEEADAANCDLVTENGGRFWCKRFPRCSPNVCLMLFFR